MQLSVRKPNSRVGLPKGLSLALSLLCVFPLLSAQSQKGDASAFRPPAVPLITHDPYFSIWSASDNLTDSETVHWTLTGQPIVGQVRIDGKPFRFMGHAPGRRPDAVPAMKQTVRSV